MRDQSGEGQKNSQSRHLLRRKPHLNQDARQHADVVHHEIGLVGSFLKRAVHSGTPLQNSSVPAAHAKKCIISEHSSGNLAQEAFLWSWIGYRTS